MTTYRSDLSHHSATPNTETGKSVMPQLISKSHVRCIIAGIGLYLMSGMAVAQQSCPTGTSPLNWSSPQGTTWDMCWSIDPLSGLNLTDVHFDSGSGRREVLGQASLAQLFVAYDDGTSATDHVTEKGLGIKMRSMTSTECFGTGAQIGAANGINALCHREIDRGYLYRWYANQAQGNLYELFSISDISKQTWIVRWRFYEDGTFEASLGSTGRLPKITTQASSYTAPVLNKNAKSYTTSAFWRLDFNIDGGANDQVREFKVAQTGDYGETQTRYTTDIVTEGGRKIKRQWKTSWQILDTVTTNPEGHNISYHLEPQQGGIRYKSKIYPWSKYDLYVTKKKGCEQYVINNPTDSCGASNLATGFANGQNIANDDIVLWFKISRHRWPRDEDMPYRSLEWDTFIVHPRDWDSLSPVTDATPIPSPTIESPAQPRYADSAQPTTPSAS